jgi:hypothetical protein
LTQFINLRVDPSLLRLKTFDGSIDYFSGEFLWHVSSELRSNPFVFGHHFTSLAGEPDKQDQWTWLRSLSKGGGQDVPKRNVSISATWDTASAPLWFGFC